MMLAVGCSPKAQETAETTTAQEMSESIQMSEIVDESREAETLAGETQKQEKAEVPSFGTKEAEAEEDDNFSADPASVEAFGRSVKEAVAEKNLETLADLAAYPLYIGFADGGVSVESREEMIALGEEKIFTQEWMDSIAQADETALSPSMAGFVPSGEGGGGNLVFGLRDGKLAVSGINY